MFFGEIMTKNILNLLKNKLITNQPTPSSINKRKSTSRHLRVKILKTKNKEKNPKYNEK